MYKNFSKIFCSVGALLLSANLAFGIDAEFKNALMKIEVIKTADDAYNIDLYTKNKFSEPVKVIKKSDLNYYILLPETKNESVRNSTNGVEIRSISTNVFPYPGDEVNNGYVKININTTKPINFKVNVKNEGSKATSVQTEVLAQEDSVIDEVTDISAQKKNSVSSVSKNKNKLNEDEQAESKSAKDDIKRPTIEQAIQQEIDRVRQEQDQIFQEEFGDLYNAQEDTLTAEELDELEKIAKKSSTNLNEPVFKSQFIVLKNKIVNKLAQYGINPRFFAIGCALLFFLMLFVLTKMSRKGHAPKLKTKAQLQEAPKTVKLTKYEAEVPEVKNDGQYFVFDKNIKQTGFCDPATSAIKKNYELSSYEPELKNRYSRSNQFPRGTQNEYDIIQKILKEDTFIDIPAHNSGAYIQIPPNVPTISNVIEVKPKATKEEVKPQVKEEAKVHLEDKKEQKVEQKTLEPEEKFEQKLADSQAKDIDEPIVLSSVEIAPSRGFMCVLYNQNINLMGYIFDDVFPLYDFKAVKLENYDIKYRLSEKSDATARFIVKVANTKMLVKVTKSAMAVEVLL